MTTPARNGSVFNRSRTWLASRNLFISTNSLSHADQLLATRVFSGLLMVALSVLIIVSALNIQIRTVTIQLPSQSIFQDLSSRYPNTLSCPCSQSSIQQEKFLSFKPSHHPVCTSKLTDQHFISSLSDPNMSNYYPIDFRLSAASHFQILATLCRTAMQAASDAIDQFSATSIVTNRALDQDAFNAQTTALVQQLQTTTIADIKHTSRLLSFTIRQNGIVSALRTNIFFTLDYTQRLLYSYGIIYRTKDGDCTCTINDTCVSQAGFYNLTGRVGDDQHTVFGNPSTDPSPLFIIPGINVGCLPYDGLVGSSLECFFNQSCIAQMGTYFVELASISPLSLSKFEQNTTVNDLFDKLFIESWNETDNFTGYFQTCAPKSCTYSYDQNLVWLYIFVTVISLFGGLSVALELCVPLLVKFIRKVQHAIRRDRASEVEQTETAQVQTLMKDRIKLGAHHLHQQLSTLNLFPSLANEHDGLYSTRVYLLLLITGIITLVIYTSVVIHTQSVTVYQPSVDQFERLYDQYSSTLVCPCTRFSSPYSSIIHIEPQYHQVCSSIFVQDNFFFSIFLQDAYIDYFVFDFRFGGASFFDLLQNLCSISKETVDNELVVFNALKFASPRALPRATFDVQTSLIMKQYEQQVTDSFLGQLELVRSSLQLNQFIDSGSLNVFTILQLINGVNEIYYSSYYFWSFPCSCGTSSLCTRPQGFYCIETSCFSVLNQPNQTIPGLVLSCLLVDSFLDSKLQCFYNATCIEAFINGRYFDLNNITLDKPSLNITALDSTVTSRFLSTTTLDTIVSQLFIEDWTNSTDFASYFDQCAPAECIYSYIQGYNTAYIISTILALWGGLTIVLQLLVSASVSTIRQVYLGRQSGSENGMNRPNRRLFTYITDHIRTVNVFKKKSDISHANDQRTPLQMRMIHEQQKLTRAYFVLFFFSLGIILLFNGLNSQLHAQTVIYPSQSTFEILQAQFSSSLSCPCSQVSIRYSTFLSVWPSNYHQVCSSIFVTSQWINTIWGPNSYRYFWLEHDIRILSSQFRLLSTLCSLSEATIAEKVNSFLSDEFISISVVTRESFQAQVESALLAFIQQAPATFRRTLAYTSELLHGNQLQNMFFTNWMSNLTSPAENYIMSTKPVTFDTANGSCSCATQRTCSRPLVLYRNNKTVILPGFIRSCLPIFGLRLSTLECLYNLSCVNALTAIAGVINSSVDALNSSLPSRFAPVSSTPVGALIDELFIEAWQNTSNYSNYFSECAPSLCHYTYVERSSVAYMITTFLGLYGGLTFGLKTVIWHGWLLWRKTRQFLAQRRARIGPIPDS